MPLRPAASSSANARYGLAAESMARYSTRALWPLLGLYSGTRTSAERLLWPQVTKLGASSPPHSRLYELTNWLVTAVISGACLSRPATNWRPIFESWYWPPGVVERVRVALEQRHVRVHAGAGLVRTSAWA